MKDRCDSKNDKDIERITEDIRITDDFIGEIMGCIGIEATIVCAAIDTVGIAPKKVNGKLIKVEHESGDMTRSLTHELGHFLGLDDYGYNNTCVYVPNGKMSLYGPGTVDQDCRSSTLTTLDLENLHEVYHPDALRNATLVANDDSSLSYWVIEAELPTYELEVHGTPDDPDDREVYPEYNAYRYLVFWRDAFSSDDYVLLKQVAPTAATYISLRDSSNTQVDPQDREFLVVGVTRGDVERGVAGSVLENHVLKQLNVGSVAMREWWTLGNPERVRGPLSPPSALTLSAKPKSITEAPGASSIATVTAQLDRPAKDTAVTVQFSVAASSSASTADYVLVPTSGEVTVPVGAREASLTILTRNDSINELDESAHVWATVSGGGIDGSLSAGPLAISIIDNDLAVAVAGATVCTVGVSVTLSAGAGGATEPTTFTWDVAVFGTDDPSPTGESVTFTCPAAGVYTITVSATDSVGGVGSATHTLTARDLAVAVAGATVCTVGVSVTLSAGAGGATEPTTFTWDVAVFGTDDLSPTGESVTFTCPAAGVYTITVSATDSVGGVGSATHTLTARDLAVAVAGATVCTVGVSVTLSAGAGGATEPTTFTWDVAVFGTDDLSPTGESVTFTCPAAGVYTITVSATDSVGGVGSATHTLTARADTTTSPTLPPAVPVIDTSRTSTTSGSITIYWTTSGDAAGLSHRVRHREQATTTWTERDGDASGPHTFSGLSAARTYELQVQARRGTARSAWSATATATTDAAPVDPTPLPAPPTNVQVSTTANSATLTWTAVGGASGYRVRQGTTGEGIYKAGASTASHTFSPLSADTSYTFGVRTVTATGSSSWVARTARTDPASPTNVQVSTTANSATLTWTAVGGASGYRVRQGTTGEGIYRVGASTASHTFRSLSADTSYTFGVRTVTATGSSSWVARTARTDPASPTNVQVSTTANSATLTWTAVGGASGYRVRQGTTGEGIYKAGASSTSHTFGGLDANTSYMFGVKAVNDHGESNWMTVNAITDAAPVVVTPPTQLSGRSGIQRMTPTSVGGWTLNLTFFLNGHGEIEPEFRFTKLDDLETTWQYTSPVSATIGGQKRALGRVAYRKTTATGDRIEIGFKPSGGSLIRPRLRGVNYSNMVLWYTYKTSEITFTLPDQSRARADSDAAYAGRLASGLAPGEESCTTCDAGVADLEPMGDTEPPPKDT